MDYKWERLNLMSGFANILTSIKQTVETPATVTDADAQAFVNAAVISNTTQANAIDNLVIGLKADSLWTVFSAIYPIVGGSASKHKWNLKNPLDTDGANRLIFSGTWTHSATGMQPSSATANTFKLVPAQNNASFFVWYTAGSGDAGYCGASSPYFIIRSGFAAYDRTINDSGWVNDASGASPNWAATSLPNTGLTGISRSASGTADRIINNTYESCARPSTGLSTNTIYLGGVNSVALTTNHTIGFACIGNGVNSTQAGNLYTRLSTYQSSLSR